MIRHPRSGLGVVAALVVASCSHGGLAFPDDPLEEARLRIAAVEGTGAPGVCAAEHVEGDRGLDALRSLKPEGPAETTPASRAFLGYRAYETRQMNLSQASAQLSAAHEQGQAAEARLRAGAPGAHRMLQYAMAGFDATHSAITNPNPRPSRGSSRAEVTLAEARYAMVWTEYLAAPPGAEGRDRLLDWLTTRSVDNLELLRAYHRDFDRALRRRCD